MKRVCLIAICLACGIVYCYEPACGIAVLDVDEMVAWQGEDTMPHFGRREHKNSAFKTSSYERKGTPVSHAGDTLNISDVDSVNRSEGSAPLSAMHEDDDSVKCSEKRWHSLQLGTGRHLLYNVALRYIGQRGYS